MKLKSYIWVLGVLAVAGSGAWLLSSKRHTEPQAEEETEATRVKRDAIVRAQLARARSESRMRKLPLSTTGPSGLGDDDPRGPSPEPGASPLEHVSSPPAVVSTVQFYNEMADEKCACSTKACLIEVERTFAKRRTLKTVATLADPEVKDAQRRAAECQSEVLRAERRPRTSEDLAAMLATRRSLEAEVAAKVALHERNSPPAEEADAEEDVSASAEESAAL